MCTAGLRRGCPGECDGFEGWDRWTDRSEQEKSLRRRCSADPDPDSAPGPGGLVWAGPMSQLQCRCQEPRTLVLSCRACLVLSGLVFQGCLWCPTRRTFGRWSHRPPPRPELLFDAPALTGHAPARPGNPSDILQETQNIRNTPVQVCTPGQTGRLADWQTAALQWAGGRPDSGSLYFRSIISHLERLPKTNLDRPIVPCTVGPAHHPD